MGSVNDQIMSCFKIKDYSQSKHSKTMCGGGKKPTKLKNQKQSEASIIKNIRNLFRLKQIQPYLRDVIINLQKSDAWKIHLILLQKILKKSV